MFDQSFKAVIKKATIKAVDADGMLKRILEPEFMLDFTESLASGLGSEATEVLGLISEGPLKKGEIDPDALPKVYAQFYSSSNQLTVKEASFVSAKITRPKDLDTDYPILTITLSFSWTDESLLYFAKRLGEEMTLRLKRSQTTIPGTDKKPAQNDTKAEKARVQKTKNKDSEKPESLAKDPSTPQASAPPAV